MSLRGCFVTGTDTEIGKTCISAGLLHLLGASLRTAGCKPIAAGTSLIDGRRVNEDVQRLREAGSVRLTDDEVGPFQFAEACAPHVAAALEGRRIDRQRLVDAVQAVAARADFIVVEGVGGFCVPLSTPGEEPFFDTADLARDLALPVVLVVGLRLGCLNHAVLTAEAVRHRGLRLAGWVANTIDPAMPHLEHNLAALRDALTGRHRAACLGMIPRLASPTAADVADHLDPQATKSAFGL